MENNVMQHCSFKDSVTTKYDKSLERTQTDKLFDNKEYKTEQQGWCSSVLQATSTLVVNALPQPNRSKQLKLTTLYGQILYFLLTLNKNYILRTNSSK